MSKYKNKGAFPHEATAAVMVFQNIETLFLFKRFLLFQQISIDADHELACEQGLLFGRAKQASRERSAPRGFAARSRVLARLALLVQIGDLARRLATSVRTVFS